MGQAGQDGEVAEGTLGYVSEVTIQALKEDESTARNVDANKFGARPYVSTGS